jgi:hypothetical protein
MSFTVEAGQVTDVGTVDFGAGSVSGVATWEGVPLAGLEPPANLAAQQLMWIQATTSSDDEAGYGQFDQTGSYSLPNVPIGTIDVGVYTFDCNLPDQVVSVDVAAGESATADIDLEPSSGQLIGRITVNGAALPYPNIIIDGACGHYACGPGSCPASDASGAFARIFPPGDYTASVQSGLTVVGRLSFSIRQGQVTDVDMGTTEVGPGVSIELSGGTGSPGGITLVFTEVTVAGQTTVVESGAGAPPDTGYRIVGLNGEPRYWDINTTAEYSGTIEVCISYDQSEVASNEQNLQLRHDDGGTWENITSSLDTDANIICGIATSLSPFAVFEPLDAPDPDLDSDGVSDDLDQCPGTDPQAVVDVDGCSVDDLCPCEDPWKNHGQYVACYQGAIQEFVDAGLISRATASSWRAAAAQSSCGQAQ